MPLSTGTHLGPYEITAPLGAGGMGEVYRARDTRLGREVALKVLPASLAGDPERRARFAQEARAASALNHPNIVTVYDIGSESGISFIVSELIQGESLRSVIAQGPMSPRTLVDIGSQIADGLAAAHAAGITHRDLKPENIMVTTDGRAKILDFGLAKVTVLVQGEDTVTQAMETKAGLILGTLGYMSPEQVRGQPVDHRTDIFSFGVILYEMLTGKRAFSAASTADMISAILKEDPPEPASGVSPAATLVVRRCLEKERARRFQSAADLAFALRNLTMASSTIAEAPPAMKSRGRRVAVGWLAVSLAIAVAIAAGGGFWFGSHAKPLEPPKFRVPLRSKPFNGPGFPRARFMPDGKNILYSGPIGDSQISKIYSLALEKGQPKEVALPENVALFAISSQGEIAGAMASADGYNRLLFRAPLAGGGARQIVDQIGSADWSPDGTELAIMRPGERDRIEYPIGHLLYEAASDASLRSSRVSRDGNLVAFVDNGNAADVIRVVDRQGKVTELARLPRGGSFFPNPVCWSPDGRELWFSALSTAEPDAIYAVGLNGKLRLLTRLPNHPILLDVSADGKAILAFQNGAGHSLLNTPLKSYPLNDVSPDLFTPDGRYYTGNGGQDEYYFGHSDGSPAIRISSEGYGRASPDGKWIWIKRLDGSFWLVPTGPGEEQRMKLDRFDQKSVNAGDWFADSRHILITAAFPGKPPAFYTLDRTDLSLQQLPAKREDTELSELMLSPDDRWIFTGYGSTMRIRRISGGDIQPVPGLLPADTFHGWADDSQSLWITEKSSNPSLLKLYRLNIVTGERRFSRDFKASGTANIYVSMMSADGRTYESGEGQNYMTLTLMDGLK